MIFLTIGNEPWLTDDYNVQIREMLGQDEKDEMEMTVIHELVLEVTCTHVVHGHVWS